MKKRNAFTLIELLAVIVITSNSNTKDIRCNRNIKKRFI